MMTSANRAFLLLVKKDVIVMLHGYLAYIVALLIASVISLLMALFLFIRRTKTGAVVLAYLMLSTSVYSLGYAFELACSTLSGMLFWSKFQYLGISIIPALWIIMVIQMTGRDRWLTRPVLIAIFIIPFTTFILHLTDSYHHLYYSSVSINTNSPFPLLAFTKGPWYWVHVAFTNLSILCGNIMLLDMWRRSAPSYSRQAAIILTASLAPWAGLIIYQTGRSPWDLDLTPFTFTCTGLITAWGLFQYRLFDLIPVARDKVFDSMRDGVLVLDTSDRIVDFNPTAQLIVKKLSKKDIGRPAKEVLADYPELLKQLSVNNNEQNNLQTSQGGVSYYYNSRVTPVMNDKNKLIGKTIVLNDITQQVLLHEKLSKLATLDALTNIFNRRHFLDLSNDELCHAKQSGTSISLILMDLDHFKQINDTYGHKAGDIVITTVTAVCSNNLRVTDLFGRYGGEEFVAFLPETSSEEAFQIAERLRQNIAVTRIELDDGSITVTASFGVASADKAGDIELDELLKNADEALYEAKEAGRNCVRRRFLN